MSHRIINSKTAARRQRDHKQAMGYDPRLDCLAYITMVGAQQRRDRQQPPKMGSAK